LAIHGGKESGKWGGPLKEKQWGKCFFEKIMERFRRQLMAFFFFEFLDISRRQGAIEEKEIQEEQKIQEKGQEE
jgi:hypothetical protein